MTRASLILIATMAAMLTVSSLALKYALRDLRAVREHRQRRRGARPGFETLEFELLDPEAVEVEYLDRHPKGFPRFEQLPDVHRRHLLLYAERLRGLEFDWAMWPRTLALLVPVLIAYWLGDIIRAVGKLFPVRDAVAGVPVPDLLGQQLRGVLVLVVTFAGVVGTVFLLNVARKTRRRYARLRRSYSRFLRDHPEGAEEPKSGA